MSSQLFNVNALDPITYSIVSLGLVITAFLASYLPSRRAAAVDSRGSPPRGMIRLLT
jgi:hypothetical protein